MVAAGGADHNGLSPSICHDFRPLGLVRPRSSDVCQLADMMHLNVTRSLAGFAGVRKEPLNELLVRIVDPDRLTVDDRCRFVTG
jgi:hypothetical protein